MVSLGAGGGADEPDEGRQDGPMITAKHPSARILIVDDELINLTLLQHVLRSAGYAEFRTLQDPREAVACTVDWAPDIVLLDLSMPYLDGYAVLERLRVVIPPTSYLPVLVLTADATDEAKKRALTLGAKDFLTKPFDHTEVLLRIGNLLDTRTLHRRLQGHNEQLEARVRQRTAELEEARLEILVRLAAAAEYRDDDTHQHTQRVGDISAALGRELGFSDADAETIRLAAPLHDLGKIGIPDNILLKPGSLTREEFAEIRRHTEIGARILAGSRFAILQMGEVIARTHHERWDGGGYHGIKGEDIPLPSRIVAVADVFDALTHVRPYKHAWPRDEALAYIRDESGGHFDPLVVAAFLVLEAEDRITRTAASDVPAHIDVSRIARAQRG
jgi:putative two-component system response regulator